MRPVIAPCQTKCLNFDSSFTVVALFTKIVYFWKRRIKSISTFYLLDSEKGGETEAFTLEVFLFLCNQRIHNEKLIQKFYIIKNVPCLSPDPHTMLS